jgi:NADPH:quinone reductase-like Zn-dependent oxidoreductase
MRAAWIGKFGGLDVIQVGERPMPERGSGEVLIKIYSATLNHRDVYLRRGEAGRYALPLIMGSDGAGTVVACDPQSPFRIGQCVVIYPVLSCGLCINCRAGCPHKCCHSFGMVGGDRNGTQAQFAVVPESCVVSMPDGLDFETASAISLAGLTAWNMVVDEGQVQSDEHALVLGASGGVGVFTVRLLKKFGVHVHVVTSSPEKADALRQLGADSVLADSAAEVLRFTRTLPDGGVDLAFNWVGGNTWRYVPPAVRNGGRILVCGTVRSPVAEMDMRQVFYRNISIIGCSMGKPESLRRILEFAAHDQMFRIPIDRLIELNEVADGHRRLEARAVMGKIVIQV